MTEVHGCRQSQFFVSVACITYAYCLTPRQESRQVQSLLIIPNGMTCKRSAYATLSIAAGTRGSSRTRVARFWLLLVACLAQLWMPPHDEHMRGVAAHVLSSHSDAASSGLATSSISAAKADIRCSPAGAQSGSHDGDAPAPCQQDNCPCCPLVHATVGILPQEAAFAGFAPLLAKTVTPPARLGAFNSSPAFAGQPRAPPVLI